MLREIISADGLPPVQTTYPRNSSLRLDEWARLLGAGRSTARKLWLRNILIHAGIPLQHVPPDLPSGDSYLSVELFPKIVKILSKQRSENGRLMHDFSWTRRGPQVCEQTIIYHPSQARRLEFHPNAPYLEFQQRFATKESVQL